MKKRGLSQETLKVIACITMLVDHIGAILVPENLNLRIVGRIAFPIYCFLLSEGAAYTRDPKKYGLRLLIGAVLSEIPFDLALYGELTWEHQSVMITLLLGFAMIQCRQKVKGFWMAPVILGFMLAAELLGTDYGAAGIAVIALFVFTREMPGAVLIQTLGLVLIGLDSVKLPLGGIYIPCQLYAVAAMVPIWLYHGRKATHGKAVQWAFYLFYPAHLLILWIVSMNSF